MAKPKGKVRSEEDGGGIEKPPEKKEPEKPILTREQSQVVADALQMMVTTLAFIPPAWIELALEGVRGQKSKYDAIGCMFDPFGMKAKTLFYEQGIAKLDAMLRFRRAMDKLEESRTAGAEAAEGKAKLAGIIGGFGLE